MTGRTKNEKLLFEINANLAAYQHLEQSPQRIALNVSLNKTLKLLQDEKKSTDIFVHINNEETILPQELELLANSPEEINSINAALEQIQDALRALEIANDPSAYRISANTYSTRKRDAKGLPLDAFREFIKSHTIRLSNRLAGRIIQEEKELLRQRKENLLFANSLYIKLQEKALADA
jgi:hypothetical protein